MINLTTLGYVNNIKNFRQDHNNMFELTVMNEELDNRDIEIISIVDKAKYIGNNTMIDRFGNTTSIANLSTGVKILLNVRWLIKNKKEQMPINITSCGDNVFPLLVEEVKDKNVNFLTYNYSILCKDKCNILVNNKYKINSFYELSKLGSKLYETKDKI